MVRTHDLVALMGGATLFGCDPVWVREAQVKVPVGAFPVCVQSALAAANFNAAFVTGEQGHSVLTISTELGPFTITPVSPASASDEILVVRFRGFDRKPRLHDVEIRGVLRHIDHGITRTCGNGEAGVPGARETPPLGARPARPLLCAVRSPERASAGRSTRALGPYILRRTREQVVKGPRLNMRSRDCATCVLREPGSKRPCDVA